MILTAVMIQLGSLAAWRTMHRLHLVLIGLLLTSNPSAGIVVFNKAVIEAFALVVLSTHLFLE